MCGRFMLDSDIEDLLRQYQILKGEVADYNKGDIYPSQKVPGIMYDDNSRALKLAKWGFPFMGKSKLVINARYESITDKPMFKNAFHNARCIIPANLFYEWKDEGDKNKAKHEIHLLGEVITSLGGIFKFIVNDEGDQELSFVLITTEANNQMKSIHSRMPLIIENDALDYWLDNNTSKNIIKEIMESNINHQLKIERNIDEPFEQMKLF